LIDFTNINIDSTHIKASANKKKFMEKIVTKEKYVFEDEMFDFINDHREDNDVKPLPPNAKTEIKRSKISTTDTKYATVGYSQY
jgi:acetyl/propionyl-CoA carboxylase alpha subunit